MTSLVKSYTVSEETIDAFYCIVEQVPMGNERPPEPHSIRWGIHFQESTTVMHDRVISHHLTSPI